MNESVTLTDNRTGESIEIPIINGGVDAGAWKRRIPESLSGSIIAAKG